MIFPCYDELGTNACKSALPCWNNLSDSCEMSINFNETSTLKSKDVRVKVHTAYCFITYHPSRSSQQTWSSHNPAFPLQAFRNQMHIKHSSKLPKHFQVPVPSLYFFPQFMYLLLNNWKYKSFLNIYIYVYGEMVLISVHAPKHIFVQDYGWVGIVPSWLSRNSY